MLETPEELDSLQQILDRSVAGAGPHLRGIITDDRRLSAAQLSDKLQGMRLMVVATVDVNDPSRGELRQAMLGHYLPLQGPAFESWLDQADAVGARIAADKIFTFSLES